MQKPNLKELGLVMRPVFMLLSAMVLALVLYLSVQSVLAFKEKDLKSRAIKDCAMASKVTIETIDEKKDTVTTSEMPNGTIYEQCVRNNGYELIQ
ncbi:MAG: hypothetical protein PVJ09_02295 [Candidatus Woesebacteria bacterium]|jgi:hypothetical protein